MTKYSRSPTNPCLSFQTEAVVRLSSQPECLGCLLSIAPIFIFPLLSSATFTNSIGWIRQRTAANPTVKGSFCLVQLVQETPCWLSSSQDLEKFSIFPSRFMSSLVYTYHLLAFLVNYINRNFLSSEKGLVTQKENTCVRIYSLASHSLPLVIT